ncbi:terminase small subunit [Pantoea ananatis]|uniref:terminase small subunit n=1 Tax=Pantoea ananas TaxID=553 RepID=UPI000232359E|nr:terminase small subunit [Pantoea ananatis]AER32578.1 phage terminase small subunit/phage head morphogenesis protein [Pantoea ananatis PA13]
MALTDKQEMFCREYLIDLNATQAAIRAGFSEKTARASGHENLTKPDVQSRIADLKSQRNEQVNIDAAYVLRRLVEIDEMDVMDILLANGELKPVMDWPKVWRTSLSGIDDLLQRVQIILDDYLLEGGSNNLWALQYVAAEYERGTHQAFTNLSVQSPIYEQQTTLQQLLSSAAYQNQVAAAYVSTYSDWLLESDRARGDLANVIADSIGRGINPKETARIISKRLDVSMARAKNMAQTEQVGALREAQWQETDWARERLGLNTALLHLSALKPTTRTNHAFWHGKTRTVEEVREWYSRDGNRYHCYCSQIPVVLDNNGMVLNSGLIDRLSSERKSWESSKN